MQKINIYYMDISEAEIDGHCYFSPVNKNKVMFSIFDQKRAEALQFLQERCRYP